VERELGIPCVIYAAKSTEDRRGSIPEQLEECREAIDADRRRRFVAEYEDEAVSAYRRDRGPGLRDATEHAEDLARECGVAELWAQHSDRLARGDGRNARHTVEIALWGLKHDIRVRTLQDPDTFRDLLYAVVTGQRNNEDSKRKAISSQAGRKRAIARGEFVGHLPDGYLLVREVAKDGQITRRIELDSDRQPPLELIFRLALRGRSCGQIACTLNSRGWETKPARRIDEPRPFDVGRVYETLKNPRYAALATYKGEILARGHWPAYITERQHHRIVERLSTSRPVSSRFAVEPYLLNGLARCGACGHRLRALSGPKAPDGDYLRRYVCCSHICDRGYHQCQAPPMRAHTVEAMFIANLDRLLATRSKEQHLPDGRHEHRDLDGLGRLREAFESRDEQQVEHAISVLFAEMQPYAALARDGIMSQRRSRELADAERLRVWVEQEANGRTPSTRAQTLELGRLLRTWFTEITVLVTPETVRITAVRRRGSGPTVPVDVEVDRAAWTRGVPSGCRDRTIHGTWEPPEIIGALQAWAEEHQRSPRQVEWKLAAADHPQALTVRKRLGSWSQALRTAALEPVLPQKHPWTDAQIIKALHAWNREHGRPPFSMEWAKAQPDHPAAATVRAHYGHWDDALYTAGLQPLRRAKHRWTPWPPAEIINALQHWAAVHGQPPHGLDWIKATPEHPCAGTVYNHFDTWTNALTTADLAP